MSLRGLVEWFACFSGGARPETATAWEEQAMLLLMDLYLLPKALPPGVFACLGGDNRIGAEAGSQGTRNRDVAIALPN